MTAVPPAAGETAYEWATALTEHKAYRRDVAAALRAEEAKHNAETVAAWRRANPLASCNDRVALLLAELALTWGGKR